MVLLLYHLAKRVDLNREQVWITVSTSPLRQNHWRRGWRERRVRWWQYQRWWWWKGRDYHLHWQRPTEQCLLRQIRRVAVRQKRRRTVATGVRQYRHRLVLLNQPPVMWLSM